MLIYFIILLLVNYNNAEVFSKPTSFTALFQLNRQSKQLSELPKHSLYMFIYNIFQFPQTIHWQSVAVTPQLPHQMPLWSTTQARIGFCYCTCVPTRAYTEWTTKSARTYGENRHQEDDWKNSHDVGDVFVEVIASIPATIERALHAWPECASIIASEVHLCRCVPS